MAVEGAADGGERREANGLGPAVLQDREVDDGDVDERREVGEGEPAPSRSSSRWIVTPCSEVDAMSDRALQVVSEPHATGEHLGQHEEGDATEERAFPAW